MHEDNGEFVSELFDVADLEKRDIDRLSDRALMGSLQRLIDETRSGLSEFSGFQNYLQPAASTPIRDGDESRRTDE